MLPHLLLVGGEHVLTGVVRVSTKSKVSYYIQAGQKEESIKAFREVPGLLEINFSSMQAFLREHEQLGNALPAFIDRSEKQVVSHRRL